MVLEIQRVWKASPYYRRHIGLNLQKERELVILSARECDRARVRESESHISNTSVTHSVTRSIEET